jgi:hypothetical protein
MRELLLGLRDEWIRLAEQIDASNREFAPFARKEDGCRRSSGKARLLGISKRGDP